MQKPRAPVDKIRVDVDELIRKIGGLLMRWGSLAFIACLCYYLYAIFGGVLQAADPGRALYLINTAGMILLVSSLATALGIILVTMEELSYTVIVGLAGATLMLGIPYLVASNLSSSLSATMQGVVKALSQWGTQAGTAVLAVVAMRVVYEIGLQLTGAPKRRKKRVERDELEEGGLKKLKTLKPPSVISRCWELPFCHERIREICPAFKARKACWRYGIGCNCDAKMIESLLRMGQPGHGPAASTTMQARQAAYVRSDLQADVVVGDKAQRTLACAKCPIYNEHQRLKFKFVNPVAIIATIVGMGALYLPIMELFRAVAMGIAQVATDISLNQGVDAGAWFAYLNTDGVKIFFFTIVGLLLLSYVLRFTEWVVLEKKL